MIGGEYRINKHYLITIILVILVGGGGFFAGMKYQEGKRPAGRFGSFQGSNGAGQQSLAQGVRPVNGEIINADDKSMTVKLQDGSSKIVLLTDTTAINKSAQGSKSDLKVGEKVAVFGTVNSDGSVTAQSVQLNPVLRDRPM